MSLFYLWLCRVIGVKSLLDVMHLYIVMLFLVSVMFAVFFPDFVDGKRHRSPHRQGHRHHNHHHHHHRKHHKLHHQLPVDEKLSVQWTRRSDPTQKNFNVTNIVNSTPWILNHTSASIIFNNSFPDKEDISTLHKNNNLGTILPTENSSWSTNALENSSSFKNYTQKNDLGSTIRISNSSSTPSGSTDLFVGSTTNFQTNPSNSQITIRLIEESTIRIFTESFANSSQVLEAKNIKNEGSVAPRTNFNFTEVEEGQDEDPDSLFGAAKNRKKIADAVNETPMVQLIRKRRSVPLVEDEGEAIDDGRRRKSTLEDFDGPAISNDSEDIGDRESANAVHVRVKRDGSELDDDRSSLDSNYLRNLEDSFALSALEVLAQGSRSSDRVKRETDRTEANLDSSVNPAKNERNSESNEPEVETKNGQVDPTKLPANPVSPDFDYVFNNRVNELGHREKIPLSVDTDFLANGVNPVSRNRVNDAGVTENYVRPDVGQGDDANYYGAGTQISITANFLAKTVNSVFRDRVNDVDQLAGVQSTVDSVENTTNYIEYVSQASSPPDSAVDEVNSISKNRVNVAEHFIEISNTLDPTSDFTAESRTSKPDDSVRINVNPVFENRVNAKNPVNAQTTLDSRQQNYAIDSTTELRDFSPAESATRDVNPVFKNRVNDVEAHTDILSPEKNESGTNRVDDATIDQSTVEDAAARSQRSPVDNSILKDDNSISRYRLDDVYPAEEAEDPSPTGRLVRTKRFGDSFVNPEAPDASYANEVDNGRTAEDEPYAEDNRVIDSMLSKVDYGGVDQREDGSARSERARPFNDEEIDAGEMGDEASIGGQRGGYVERTGRKAAGRRDFERKKRRRVNRARTRRCKRSGIKRISRDLSDGEYDRENSRPNMKREADEVRSSSKAEGAILSDGERRGRESEDEDEENFFLGPDDTAGRVRRDVRGIRADDFNGNAKSRGRRNTARREVENLKNRDADLRQNRSEGIVDKHLLRAEAAEPIRDMKQLVMQLLTKVDELNGYIAGGNGVQEQSKSYEASGTLSNTSNVGRGIEGPPNLQQVAKSVSAENAAPRPINSMERPEACWKHPTSWSREPQPPKTSRPARNLRGQRCGKNLRRKRKSNRKWDRWTDWSSCSVTCGRGRQIRWRHCTRNCSNAETEMEEKACQLPACAPGKFLGIFG